MYPVQKQAKLAGLRRSGCSKFSDVRAGKQNERNQ